MAVVKNKPKYIHVANSATSLWHKVCGGNMIRLGISAYGLNPSGGEIAKLPYELQPALSFTTEIDFVKYVKKVVQSGMVRLTLLTVISGLELFRLAMRMGFPEQCRASPF